MKYEPKLAFYCGSTLLEGPVWDERRQALLCVSIEQACVYQISLASGEVKTFRTDGAVGCALLTAEGSIVAAAKNGLYRIDIDSGKSEFLVQLNEEEQLRYNDGALDAKGRILVGTMGYGALQPYRGCLYSWDGSQKKILVEGTTISNGIAFSKDSAKMYFVDTPTKKVGCYTYDLETGSAQFARYAVEIVDAGVPDGICMDDEGMLWVAQWGGAKVSRWNPETGEKLDEIPMPCKNVSSCCLGGAKRDTLFVTTAKHDDGSESEELAGGLFAVKLKP